MRYNTPSASKVFCYSHGSLTGTWAVVTTTVSLVLRNTGSPDWPRFIQLAVFPVFFLISCLLTIQKNKWPWPPVPHQPFQYLLKWLFVTESCHSMHVRSTFWTVLFFRNRNHSFSFLCLSSHRVRSTETTKSSQSMAIDWRMMSWLSRIDLGCTYPAEEIKGSQTGPLKSEKDKGCHLHRDNYTGTVGNVAL